METIVTTGEMEVLSALNARFINNFLGQDAREHAKIIHPDFICIESNGQIVNRDVYLENWSTDFDNSGYIYFSYDKECIHIFGNIALVRSRTTYKKWVGGFQQTGYTIFTDTYLKEEGEWRCVQVQITPVAP